jgi:hypothetical protein
VRLQSLRDQTEYEEIRRDLMELNCESRGTLLPGMRINWISDTLLGRYLDMFLQSEVSPLEVARINWQMVDELHQHEEVSGKIWFVASTFLSRLQEILLNRGGDGRLQVVEKTRDEIRLEALERALESSMAALRTVEEKLERTLQTTEEKLAMSTSTQLQDLKVAIAAQQESLAKQLEILSTAQSSALTTQQREMAALRTNVAKLEEFKVATTGQVVTLVSQMSAFQGLKQTVDLHSKMMDLHSRRMEVLKDNLYLYEPEHEGKYYGTVWYYSGASGSIPVGYLKKQGKFRAYPAV